MKKNICFLLVAAILFSFTGCNSVPTESFSSYTAPTESLAVQEETDSDTVIPSAVEEEPVPVDDYTTLLFDRSLVHTIDITISEDDWQDLLAHPTDTTKYTIDITIDGETLEEVSFSTKGNTSLTSIANSDSDRYSFKINFGKYRKEQTYHGLDKLHLNNTFSDTTYMKDYFAYRIMEEAGVPAPLTSFVSLSINGALHGLYLAVEGVDDSFLTRNYGDDKGELYKPETMAMNGGKNKDNPDAQEETEAVSPSDDKEAAEAIPSSDAEEISDSPVADDQAPPADFPGFPGGNGDFPGFPGFPGGDGGFPGFPGGGGGGGFPGFPGSTGGGADLKYIDDDPESYSSIFDNAESKIDEEDQTRLITALKQLSEGDADSSLDTAEVVAYFAAHNLVVNYDSYTSNMNHNYILYERGGKLSIFPWDYNLGFGGFNLNDTNVAVNYPMDDPLNGTTAEDRPLWGIIENTPALLEAYHSSMDQLLDYFESGRFEQEITELAAFLRPYVEKDPSAFYDVEAFDSGVDTLRQFCLLRAESLRGQLNGSIPATSEGQSADSSALIDTGDLDVTDLGSMGGGGGAPGGAPGGFPGFPGGGGDGDFPGFPDFPGAPDDTAS